MRRLARTFHKALSFESAVGQYPPAMAQQESPRKEGAGSASSSSGQDQLGVALQNLLQQAEKKGSVQSSLAAVQEKKKSSKMQNGA